jgi:hypothetical protein
VAPVIHDFTYEPLVYDVLDVLGTVWRRPGAASPGDKDGPDCTLDEKDHLWVDVRHKFILDVIAQSKQWVKEMGESAVGRFTQGGGAAVRGAGRGWQLLWCRAACTAGRVT